MKRLQFALERLLLRGVHYRLLVAALIVALVAVVAGVLVRLLDPQFEELSAAVWLFGSALGLLGWMRRKKA